MLRTLMMVALVSVFAGAEERPEDWKNAARDAVVRGGSYLIKTKNPNGSWGKMQQPAISALAALALHGAACESAEARGQAVDSAMEFATGFRRDDGSIQAPVRILKVFKVSGYPVYTTSLTLLAMQATDPERYREPMLACRSYLLDMQIQDGSDSGGLGYDSGKRADLSNTNWAAEALYKTNYLGHESNVASHEEAERTAQMWQDLDTFLAGMQNLEGDEPSERDGGFRYSAGGDLVSTGAMSYAGLKSMVYAQISRADPRVLGAWRYVQNNYSVLAEPVKGEAGLYYYYLTMAKALNAYGAISVPTPEGPRHWRKDLAARLVELQRPDGSWRNENGRYFEAMPELVTSYALLALRETLDTAN